MKDEKKPVEKSAKKANASDGLVEVTYTAKSVKAGQKARIGKTIANILAKKGKVIINK
jgi:hypothetical protein